LPRRVLKAKRVVGAFLAAAPRVLVLRRVLCCDRLAPRGRIQPDEGGVALVPFGDPLLEVARALPPHVQRGKRLEQLEQPLKANPLRLWEGVRVSGREITHDEGVRHMTPPATCRRSHMT